MPLLVSLVSRLIQSSTLMVFNMGQSHPLFSFFRSFKQVFITILTTNKCEKCPSSIRRRDSNSQPPNYESPPLTTRPTTLTNNVCIFPDRDPTRHLQSWRCPARSWRRPLLLVRQRGQGLLLPSYPGAYTYILLYLTVLTHYLNFALLHLTYRYAYILLYFTLLTDMLTFCIGYLSTLNLFSLLTKLLLTLYLLLVTLEALSK